MVHCKSERHINKVEIKLCNNHIHNLIWQMKNVFFRPTKEIIRYRLIAIWKYKRSNDTNDEAEKMSRKSAIHLVGVRVNCRQRFFRLNSYIETKMCI